MTTLGYDYSACLTIERGKKYCTGFKPFRTVLQQPFTISFLKRVISVCVCVCACVRECVCVCTRECMEVSLEIEYFKC